MSRRPEGIAGVSLAGPFPAGAYAAALRDRLRAFERVQVFGEVVGFKRGRARVYWELRDGAGALPCSMWADDWDALGLPPLSDGVRVVAAGGCDFYPGSRTSSPHFTFSVGTVRLAGEGDLLAQLAELRRRLASEGLFEAQRRLARPSLPRCIGVVTGEHGKARDDVLAGLRRRGWSGRVVWAFAPVQDRHAAGAITRALQDLAARPEIETIVVARGGGSLMDLFAFCDETLCRTVSLLRVPVIASVGHHTDRTLIDDVAAVSCSTPTHAAEAAVPVHCAEARERVHALGARLAAHGQRAVAERSTRLAPLAGRLPAHARRAVLARARHLAALSRAPAAHVERHRARLHQQLREIRASALRGTERRDRDVLTRATVLRRKADAAQTAASRATGLERLALALAAHDPDRTLERGYALVQGPDGEPVVSADTARTLDSMTLRLHDGTVPVRR